MKVYLSISDHWPTDSTGKPRSVNSVCTELKGTPNEVGANTLRLALDGRLDRGHLANLVKLSQIATQWAGETITIDDLLKIKSN